MRFVGRAAAALVGLVLWASPGAAVQPAPLAGAGLIEATPVQFRFPWQSERKPQRRTKKPAVRKDKARSRKPAEAQRGKEAPRAAAPKKPVEKPVKTPVDPLDAALPARLAPLGLLPAGLTQRDAEGWAAVAAQAPAPDPVPLLAPDGPAPASAHVLALLGAMRTAEPVAPPRPAPPGDDEDETPDLHVPLPPVRPAAPGETAAAASREGLSAGGGLAPEGGPAPEAGLSPEGGGLSPEGVPLPPSRPGAQTAAVEPRAPLPPEPPPGPSAPDIALPVTTHDEDPDCGALADAEFAAAERLPPIEGPGACGGGPLVSLTSVKRKDGGQIKLKPAATLRCGMAKELATYLRDDLAPAAKLSGAELERLEIAGSFQCRGRNGATAGKMSEHGRANAVDLSGVGLSDGRSFGIFARDLPEALAKAAKSGACGRFSTVLGPGSDGFHESHLHIDLQPRRSKSKLCQWSEPEVARAPDDKGQAEAAKDSDDKDKAQSSGKPDGAAKEDPSGDPPPKRKASAAARSERPKDAAP